MMSRSTSLLRKAPISLRPAVSVRFYATPNQPIQPNSGLANGPATPPSSGPGGPAGSAGSTTNTSPALMYGGGAIALVGLGYYFFGGGSLNSRASAPVQHAEAAMHQGEGYVKGFAGQAEGTSQGLVNKASGKASELSGKAKGQYEELAGKAKGSYEEAKGEVKKAMK
ncbi:uncharacterized protein IL334_002694 [Kwoniella shivajii]|uniref:Uncharacterized protein n=1 Tax=Kwoniella shivajii TaxID=564305 RepID=A0ABZ1CVU0_9TREE|nr:hypothetical protein IL334_002694 [Kwoniella shivajii]